MKRRSIVALCLVAVAAAPSWPGPRARPRRRRRTASPCGCRWTRSPAGRRPSRPRTRRSQKQHPGVKVNVQYQEWTTHLQKFDATLAGGNTPDVIEMGNTEMTKYMAAGAFADLTADKAKFPNSSTWLGGLTQSASYDGKLMGVPYYAGSRVVIYRTDLFKKAGDHEARRRASRSSSPTARRSRPPNSSDKTFSAFYIAGQGLVLGARLRLRLRRTRSPRRRTASGSARSTSRGRSPG